MIVLIAAVLLALVVGVALVGGASGLAGDERRSTGLGAAAAVPAAVALGIVVLLVVAVGGVGGFRGRSGPDEAPAAPAASVEGEAERDDPVALVGPGAVYEGRVTIDAAAAPFHPPPVVDRLAAGDVVEVRGAGFPGPAEGVVAQCSRADGRAACRNVARVFTDDEGRLYMPYRVEGSASGEVLVVDVELERGAARLTFGGAASDPAVLTLVDATTVRVRGASAGERVEVRRCDPDAERVEACESVASLAVGADGTATARLSDRLDDGSVVTVVGADGIPLAESVRVVATPRSPADVDLAPKQLLVGFGLALVLLGLAVTLIRTTDWRVPAEAATPFLDAAPLEP